ncbi:hypothetical protein ACLB2K_062694 [Fragaria x ananassa]
MNDYRKLASSRYIRRTRGSLKTQLNLTNYNKLFEPLENLVLSASCLSSQSPFGLALGYFLNWLLCSLPTVSIDCKRIVKLVIFIPPKGTLVKWKEQGGGDRLVTVRQQQYLVKWKKMGEEEICWENVESLKKFKQKIEDFKLRSSPRQSSRAPTA